MYVAFEVSEIVVYIFVLGWAVALKRSACDAEHMYYMIMYIYTTSYISKLMCICLRVGSSSGIENRHCIVSHVCKKITYIYRVRGIKTVVYTYMLGQAVALKCVWHYTHVLYNYVYTLKYQYQDSCVYIHVFGQTVALEEVVCVTLHTCIL